MARLARDRHATEVTGVDDPTKQISLNAWNADPTDDGMLGFSIQAILTIVTGVVTVVNPIIELGSISITPILAIAIPSVIDPSIGLGAITITPNVHILTVLKSVTFL